MDIHHALLGRRTLEEIHQQRVAERLSKTSSGPDLSKIPNSNAQLQDLQMRNVELEEENKKLTSQLQENKVENDILQKRLNVPMKDCLQRNEELHVMLDKLRTQQATVQSLHSEFLKGFFGKRYK